MNRLGNSGDKEALLNREKSSTTAYKMGLKGSINTFSTVKKKPLL